MSIILILVYWYYYNSGSWPYHNCVLLFVEDPGHGFVLCRDLVDFPGNRVCSGYCIDCGYSDMCLSAFIVLRSLASASQREASELSATTLTVRSVASILTWGSIIIIMIIVIGVIVSVCFVCLLVFWWVLSVTLRFSFRFTSTSGLLQFCPLERWGYFFFIFINRECDMGI